MLRQFGERPSRRSEEPPAGEPRAPITQVVEQSDGRPLIFSYGEVYEASFDLEEWTALHDLALRYLPGRPDAVGSYPAITKSHLVGENPVDPICTTLRDGLIRLQGGSEARLALPGQLGAVQIGRIEASQMGLVVVEGPSYLDVNAPWRFDRDGWRPIEYVPSVGLLGSLAGHRGER